MTHPHVPDPHHREHDQADVVPGTPPVPITIWRTPTGEDAALGHRLATRLLAAYSRPGDLVYDTTNDHQLRKATTGAERRYRPARGNSRDQHPAEPATLAVASWPLAEQRLAPDIVLGGIRRRLRPGGILTVILTGDADTGQLVDAATAARLSYLQHIVAVHAHTDHDRLQPTPQPTSPATTRPGAAHLRIHTDLLIFQKLAKPAGSGISKGVDADA